jgi:putative transposase
MMREIIDRLRARTHRVWRALGPHIQTSVAVGAVSDLIRTRRELMLENAMLRHQIVILRRKSREPRLTMLDRLRILAAAVLLPTWRRALAIVQPETVLRWHREGFLLFWRRRSRRAPRKRRLAPDTVRLIKEMAAKNRLWGAERIRGELLKLGIPVSKRTVQKYMQRSPQRGGGQRWSTFVKNHAHQIWCCDFVQAHDVFFRPLYLFFLMNQGSRRVVRVAATRNPTCDWTARQLREATMDGDSPRILIRDRDGKFGTAFDRVAEDAGVRVIKTAIRAPNMNAVAERFVGSLRREALDHLMLLGPRDLDRVGCEYARYFNKARPHQGLMQRVPDGPAGDGRDGDVVAVPVLGGLHHDYRRAA